eukprot:TRINITY_DN1571_c0_g1_i4.p1 TRINITY_DN1571_c0_g1~~TRINITY_DN1571_c0_g1_i4.p1  ORF type:complete len:197 (-),score=34.92 TRINITY_DN1571_c0_g1_i4:365-955(-)
MSFDSDGGASRMSANGKSGRLGVFRSRLKLQLSRSRSRSPSCSADADAPAAAQAVAAASGSSDALARARLGKGPLHVLGSTSAARGPRDHIFASPPLPSASPAAPALAAGAASAKESIYWRDEVVEPSDVRASDDSDTECKETAISPIRALAKQQVRGRRRLRQRLQWTAAGASVAALSLAGTVALRRRQRGGGGR